MAYVRNFYGNGLSAGNLVANTTAGDHDDTFNATAGSSGPPTIELVDGNPAIKITEAAGTANFRWEGLNLANWSIGFLYRVVSQPSAGATILQVLDSTPTQICRLTHGSSGNLILANTGNTTIDSAAGGTIQVDTWYWITVVGDGTDVTVKIYAEGSGTPIDTLTGAHGSANALSRTTYGSVVSVTCAGRYFENIVVADKAVEPAQPGEAALPVRVTSNPGTFAAVGGGDLVDVVGDASDTTYAESPTDPDADVITYQLGPLSRTDNVTVVVRGAAADVSPTISREIAIVHDGVDLNARTDNLTTTPTDYSLATPNPVAAGEIVTVRITDTAL